MITKSEALIHKHRERVQHWIYQCFIEPLAFRAKFHDRSKLIDTTEITLFEKWTPKLEEVEFGSEEYKLALEGMGEALQAHYKANRHHPEHFEHGIHDMSLIDIVEMVSDWMAAAEAKHTSINLEYLMNRFGIEDQLANIIINTLQDIDYDNAIYGVPVIGFSPKLEHYGRNRNKEQRKEND